MKKIAVFPGSFDPITNAHVDLVEQGLKVFDHVIIAIGVNSVKRGFYSSDKRLEMIEKVISRFPKGRVTVDFFEGLTVNYCNRVGAKYILRGMRGIQDFESERAIAAHNSHLNPEIQTVFFVSPGHLAHLSSTIIREIIINNGDVKPFVPKDIWHLLPTEAKT